MVRWGGHGWSCRGGVGHVDVGGSCRGGWCWGGCVMQGWGRVNHIRVWKSGNYRVLNLEMSQDIKSDRTIMEMQDNKSVTPKY